VKDVTKNHANQVNMKAEINLMDPHKGYIVKDGNLITFDLPQYGNIEIVCFAGKADRIETKTSMKV
jgi:hypothetical protein